MLKLLQRSLYNIFWSLDVLVSAVLQGAKSQTISARLYQYVRKGTLPAATKTDKIVAYPFKWLCYALDGVVYGVFGEKAHTLVAYEAWIASKTALGIA